MRSHEVIRGRIPADQTPFIGRAQEVREVIEVLGRARLVSLAGVGGIGKTRLAKAVATQRAGSFDDGAYFVDLAIAGNPELVEQTILDAFGQQGHEAASLHELLGQRECLLVLDGCESVVEMVSPIVEDLIAWCPGVKVIVTTRTALGIAAENLYFVPSMSTTAAGNQELSDAAALFVERSRAVAGAVSAGRSNDVEALCRQLDGIPLAIELAAGRSRVMSAAEIASHLDHRFELLRDTPGRPPTRQESLESVLSWTWDRCSPDEQQLWITMSTFRGAVTIDTIAAVHGRHIGPELLTAIDQLVWRSILVSDQTTDGSRYSLLDTVNAYGRIRAERDLGATAVADLRIRHMDHFVEAAQHVADTWFGRRQPQQLGALESAVGNLRVAFEWAISHPEHADAAQDMFAAMWPYWIAGGHIKEALVWANRLTSATATRPEEHSTALLIRGWVELVGGHRQEARRALVACQQQARLHGHHDNAHLAKGLQGCLLSVEGNHGAGLQLLREALADARDQAGPWIRAMLLELNAEIGALYGDPAQSVQLCDECEALCDDYGDIWCRGLVSWVRSLIYLADGDSARALNEARKALKMKTETHDHLGVALATEVVAWALTSRGDHGNAAVLLGMTGTYWSQSGSDVLIGIEELRAQRRRSIRVLRAELGDESAESMMAGGAKMPVMQSFAFIAASEDKGSAGREAVGGRLTPREAEVARLVATGMTNREIGSALFIGTRTVDTHVANVLRKLRLNRRGQIADLKSPSRPVR